MSFYEFKNQYKDFDIIDFSKSRTLKDVENVLAKDKLDILDYATLISDAVDDKTLEHMAEVSKNMTEKQFGRTISIYAPIYLSNYCVNNCKYCGFRKENKIHRRQLEVHEVIEEAKVLSSQGIKHVLILTGENEKISSLDYISSCVQAIKPYFSSISIEVYPVDTKDYERLVALGVDGVTIYQETYDEHTYSIMHSGPKADYKYRIETPDRAAEAKMRTIGVGALLGLYNPIYDNFYTALHAKYLMDKYTDCDISVSFPRIQPEVGGFQAHSTADDRMFLQFLLASRIFLPRIGITVSTRENAVLRDNIIGLGVTKFSAGSKTDVGGYSSPDNTDSEQFIISDDRSIKDITETIYKKGYQPIFTDWV
jgi:2-iminoacetate synthase